MRLRLLVTVGLLGIVALVATPVAMAACPTSASCPMMPDAGDDGCHGPDADGEVDCCDAGAPPAKKSGDEKPLTPRLDAAVDSAPHLETARSKRPGLPVSRPAPERSASRTLFTLHASFLL